MSPKLMAYLKWLIYTAAFKEPLADARGTTHMQFYLKWTETFASKQDAHRKKLFDALEIWYESIQPSKKRGRSLLAAGPVSVGGGLLDDPEHDEPPSGAGARGAGAR